MAINPLQVFGKGFGQWKKNLWTSAGIVALLYAPFFILAAAGVFLIGQVGRQAAVIIPAVVVLVLLGIYVFSCAPIAVLLASLKSRSGKAKVFTAITESVPHVWGVFATNLLSGLCLAGVAVIAAGLGFIISQTVFKVSAIAGGVLIGLDVLAGVGALAFFGVRLSMGVYACVLEKKGPLASLHRSFALVKKHFFPVLGVYLLFAGLMLAVLAPAFVFAAVAPKAGQAFQALIRIGAELFVTPLFINTALVLWDELKAAEAK